MNVAPLRVRCSIETSSQGAIAMSVTVSLAPYMTSTMCMSMRMLVGVTLYWPRTSSTDSRVRPSRLPAICIGMNL